MTNGWLTTTKNSWSKSMQFNIKQDTFENIGSIWSLDYDLSCFTLFTYCLLNYDLQSIYCIYRQYSLSAKEPYNYSFVQTLHEY